MLYHERLQTAQNSIFFTSCAIADEEAPHYYQVSRCVAGVGDWRLRERKSHRIFCFFTEFIPIPFQDIREEHPTYGRISL